MKGTKLTKLAVLTLRSVLFKGLVRTQLNVKILKEASLVNVLLDLKADYVPTLMNVPPAEVVATKMPYARTQLETTGGIAKNGTQNA